MSTYTVEDVTALRARLERELRCESVALAAQRFTEVLFEELEGSAVLFRVFATVPLRLLPEREHAFARELADSRDVVGELDQETPVVCLLGTCGRRAPWNDRHQSSKHLAVPLTSASFIQTIPMVAQLMSEMNGAPAWVSNQRAKILVKSIGQMARVLYVEDAATAKTMDGFDVIPDRDFVSRYRVGTVLGLGGAYLSGAVVAAILFTNESMPRRTVEKFMPLINTFKIATMKLVADEKIF